MSRNPPLPPSPPAEPIVLDWGLLSATPSCCVCGEAYVPAPGEQDDGGNPNDRRKSSSSSAAPKRRGAPGGADESFVVLPDSTPVLSESYFSLSRNHGPAASGNVATHTTHTSHEMGYAGADGARNRSRIFGYGTGSGNGSAVGGSATPGSELLESGYGYGSGLGGWTGSGYSVGSSSMLLESIVQISHAGLCDNVRRESLLYELSKRPPRSPGVGVADGVGGIEGAGGGTGVSPYKEGGSAPPPADEGGGLISSAARGSSSGVDEEGLRSDDPTLCCHCYASLLEQIDEDSRVADREALAFRDFVELLDGITDDGGGATNTSSFSPSSSSSLATISDGNGGGSSSSSRRSHRRRGGSGASVSADSAAVAGDSKEAPIPGVPLTKASPNADEGGQESGVLRPPGGAREAESPFAQALRMAEQTSVQLRTELDSLESQRAALCARGTMAWAALSELAYARGVLGDECRELLQVSKEVAEKAAELSRRSALSDLFSIRHMDGFPSINGYRLGRSPDDKRRLHWNEINAAWGEAVLLIRCVSSAVDFHSRRFRLVPLNSASRVTELAYGDEAQGRGEDSSETAPIVFAHDLFSTGGGRGDDKNRLLAAVRAFLACSCEAIAHVERRVLERRLEGEMTAGAACVAWSEAGMPYRQTEDAVGGVSIGSLKSQASWKAWLCQLVKNLEWAVGAASSLCAT